MIRLQNKRRSCRWTNRPCSLIYRWIFALAVKVWGLAFTSVKYTFFLCEHSLKRIWQLKFHTFYDANDQTWDKNELRQRQIRLSHPTSKSEVKVPLFWNVYAVLLVPPGVRIEQQTHIWKPKPVPIYNQSSIILSRQLPAWQNEVFYGDVVGGRCHINFVYYYYLISVLKQSLLSSSTNLIKLYSFRHGAHTC